MEEALIPLVIVMSIIMAIIYFKTKKIFSLAFSLSAITYVTGVIFTIDAFDLGEEVVFLMLIISAILMIFVGLYLNHLKNGKKKRK